MTQHRKLLSNMMELLVDEWGYEEVRRTLAQLADRPRHVSRDRAFLPPLHSRKPTAIEQVIKLRATGTAHANLLILAEKFDRREFLPSTGDVREFLAMMGENVEVVKDRSGAFRRLLHSLSSLPSDRLEHLAHSSSHSGPAQLGPLSDAIKSTGESIRRSGKPPELTENS